MNQEPRFLEWWGQADDIRKELFRECLQLTAKLYANDPIHQGDYAVLTGILLPIVRNDGRLPESIDFETLCARHDIVSATLPDLIKKAFDELTQAASTTYIAERVLEISDRRIRRLIAKRAFPAEKVKGKWRVHPVDALRWITDP